MPLSDVVNVSITRQTQSVAVPSFNVIGILSDECNFIERSRVYSSLASMVADLASGTGSYAYALAAKIFGQSPRCAQVKLLNRGGTKTIQGNAGTFTAGAITLRVNGTLVSSGSYTSDKATTMAALATAIATVTGVASATYTGATDSIKVTLTTAGPLAITAIVMTGITGTLLLGVTSPVTITDDAGTFTAGSISTTVNGTTVTTAWGTAKSNTLTAHAAAILADTTLATQLQYVVSSGAVITIYPKIGYGAIVTSDLSAITGTMTMVVGLQGTEAYATALNAILLYDPAWYGLVVADASSSKSSSAGLTTDSAAVVNQLAIAVWVEANGKFAAFGTSDPVNASSVLISDTTSIGAKLHTAGYVRSFVFYSTTADTTMCDAAILGKILPYTPGSYTAKFKTLTGIVTDNLSDTHIANLRAKCIMHYISLAGVSMTQEGATAQGEWIDTIIGIDWQTALIQTYVFALLVRMPKVPYDDSGITAVVGEMNKALEAGINSGLYTKHLKDEDGFTVGGYEVVAPKASAIAANDKNLRTLTAVTFTAFLAGAIHATTINGTVTV